MMRGGLGSRIGREEESYELGRLDRGAVRDLVKRAGEHRQDLIRALAATILVAMVSAGLPLLLRLGIDTHIAAGDLAGLGLVILTYAALQGAVWWAAYWQRLLAERIGQRLVASMRRDLFSHLLTQGMDFFSQHQVGGLLSRLTGDLNSVAEVASSGSLGLVADLVGVLLTAAVMFVLDWRLALVALAMIPVVLGSSIFFGRKLRQAYAQVRSKAADVGSNLQETLAGMRVVQSLAQESASLDRFDQVNISSLRASMYAMIVFAVFFPLMTITGNLGTAAVLGYGGYLVSRGAITLGTLVAFLAYVRSFFGPLRELSQVHNTFEAAGASLARFWEVLQHKPSVQPPAEPVRPEKLSGEIEFRDVHFGYGRGTPVFSGLSLTIPAGRRLAIVGPSGAGKTTLVNLLTRFWDTESGAVLLDGVDVRQWPTDELRRVVAVIPQEAGLLPGTVLDNIAYGVKQASLEQVTALAEQLGVDGLLAGLPQGYGTRIGPGGTGRVSGGQRQVIAILRAVLRDPLVLVLDEATSNVDGRTEAMINSGLEKALVGRTGIVIAHRLRGVALADEIAVVDKGAIVGYGTHDELLSTSDLYRTLYDTQGLAGAEPAAAKHRGRGRGAASPSPNHR